MVKTRGGKARFSVGKQVAPRFPSQMAQFPGRCWVCIANITIDFPGLRFREKETGHSSQFVALTPSGSGVRFSN